LEVIGQADERDFFEALFPRAHPERLAEAMPSARKKQEVPLWFILAANLSLKLHQENSFLAFERVVRCGGLLAALPPDLATKHLDLKTRQWALQCQGFNDKNSYDRATPCDQDTLRKALRDVAADRWLEWFNGPVQQVFQEYGYFDPEGLFIGDASYLFVQTTRLRRQRRDVVRCAQSPRRLRQTQCGAAAPRASGALLQMGESAAPARDAYVYAAVALLPGNAHEVGPFFELVEQFVQIAGKGVIKWLIIDRALLMAHA